MSNSKGGSYSYCVNAVTRLSVEEGIIPGVCPICLNSVNRWELHHWGPGTLYTALRDGRYRRMCQSCNHVLAPAIGTDRSYWTRRFKVHGVKLYEVEYTWEEQFDLLCGYFRSGKSRGGRPNFDGVERLWSRLLPLEEERLRLLLVAYGVLRADE